MKSASAPPRGGAREPVSLLWTDGADAETSCSARSRWCAHLHHVTPTRSQQRTNARNITASSLLLPHTKHIHSAATNSYATCTREACDEALLHPPSHPTFRQPGLRPPCAAFRLPLLPMLGEVGDLGWGPRIRHLVHTHLVPLLLR
jgi:hypothetical protein